MRLYWISLGEMSVWMSRSAKEKVQRDAAVTVAEIVQLTDIALGKAREVEQYAAHLARLTEAGS